MTKEKQRQLIAEHCGFSDFSEKLEWEDDYEDSRQVLVMRGRLNGSREADIRVPNYLDDLNAMHAAWCTLSETQHYVFRRHLQYISGRDGKLDGPCRSVCNATAAQRAEAFIRTLGKWEEE